MNQTLIWQIILQLFLIALNAIFACAEIAVISTNDNKLEKLANSGDKRAKRLVNLTASPARFLATIQVAITLSGFLGSAFAAGNFSEILVTALVAIGVPVAKSVLQSISVVLITLILSYITLVFGELVPKRIAMRNAEKLALAMSFLISFIAKLFAPLVWLLTVSTNGILKLMGIDPHAEDDEVTEEEIRMMVDSGSEKGAIDVEEKEFIQNVFDFDDINIEEICTHRTALDLLWLQDDDKVWEETIKSSLHSYFPICDESVDDIVGVLNARLYFRLPKKTRSVILKQAVTSPQFVFENTKADILLAQMKQSKNYFAIVLDEYGGTSGIITMSDLIEQLVGITDELHENDEEPDIIQIDDDTWKIAGGTDLEDVEELFQCSLPTEEYDTFSGYIFSLLDQVPADGSNFHVDTEYLDVQVMNVVDHIVEHAMVKRKQKNDSK